MALISAGVETSVDDRSFYIPSASPTSPLIFLATASEKLQPNGDPATGTYEANTIRTITSLTQSIRLYGYPVFKEDVDSNPLHGDSRNEYGLFALNQYLGLGNRAYVVRANVNLNDDRATIDDMWEAKLTQSAVPQGVGYIIQSRVAQFISQYNTLNGLVDTSDLRYKTAVSKDELIPIVEEALEEVLGIKVEGLNTYFDDGTFKTTRPTFYEDQSASPLAVYGNGFDVAPTGTYYGVLGAMDIWEADVTSPHVSTQQYVPVTSFTTPTSIYFVDNSAMSPATSSQIVRNDNLGWTGVLAGDKIIVENAENPDNNATTTTTAYTVLSISTTTNANDTLDLVLTDVVTGGASSPADLADTSADVTILRNTYGFWTAVNARTFFNDLALDYMFTTAYINATTLGATDTQRREAIVEALSAAIVSNTDVRSDQYEYNLILCPGYHEVVDSLITLASDISDEAFVIADTPMTRFVDGSEMKDPDPENIVAWAGTSEKRTSTNCAYYYPHGIGTNLDGREVYVAASGTACRVFTYNDNVSQLWVPPAGTQRGVVSDLSRVGYVTGTPGTATTFVELALNRGQKDDLYKNFTMINPIVFVPNRGILVMGQKTSANAASAMDRINVSRLIGYVRRKLRVNTLPFVFQPNDELTRLQLKGVVESLLADIMLKRGLYDYAVICDETVNTPDRIDNNELYVEVYLKPVKAAEFIYIPITIVSTGADI